MLKFKVCLKLTGSRSFLVKENVLSTNVLFNLHCFLLGIWFLVFFPDQLCVVITSSVHQY